MAINTSIQNLINSNRTLSTTDIDNLFYYFYGRKANDSEKKYWSTKTSTALAGALAPNANQFKNAGYYKDTQGSNLVTPPNTPPLSPTPTTPTSPTASPTTVNKEIGLITDNGNGTYTYINKDGTPHMGKWGDNYVDNTKPAVASLTEDQVKKAFEAYGFTPNTADLQYWSLKPSTDLVGLHEKLQARKDKTTISQNNEAAAGANADIKWADSTRGGLVKFATDPDGSGPLNTSTVFWVNPTTKKIIPITSASAFDSFFGKKLSETTSGTPTGDDFSGVDINIITADYLGDEGALGKKAGYTIVPLSQGINGTDSDNVYKTTPENIDSSKISTIYGKEKLPTDKLTKTLEGIDGFLDAIQSDPNAGVSAEIINQIKNDQTQVAFYMNALAYGGYTLPDIFKDLKRKQLIKDGNTDLQNTKVISDTEVATNYYNTAAGSAAKSNPALTPPKYLGKMNMDLLNYPIFQLPEETFKVLVPPFDPYSEEGKAEMAKVQSSFYDVVQQQLNATTEREKAIADQNYKDLQKSIQDKYGVNLSANATTAWNQINTIINNASRAGISGSGIEAESIAKQLQATRKEDMLSRKSQQTEADARKAEQLMKYASPSEIAALSDEEKVKYGFKPSASTLNYFSQENLKKLFPTLSDEQINAYKNSILDENGNYRSDLYQTLYKNTYGTSAGLVVPEGGVQPAKSAYQQETIINKKALEEEKKYAPFTTQDTSSKPIDTTGTEAGSSSSGITQVKPIVPAGISPSNSDYWSVNKNNKLNQTTTSPTTPTPTVTPLSPTANKKVSVKDKFGNMITVYESSIPSLRAEGTII